MRIDPHEDADACGRAASFVRAPGLADRNAVSLRLAGDPESCLAHDSGRLVVASPGGDRRARERATFRAS